jgi:cephalosporin hydroxylase
MDLDQLFSRYGTDKASSNYAATYSALFKRIRQEPLQLLEIGIGTMIPGAPSSMVGYGQAHYKPGASLRAWRDYFPNAEVVGWDVQADTQFEEERITTYICNSTSKADVAAWRQQQQVQFDIIIDDGSHLDHDQLASLTNCWPLLKANGFYVVEDLVPKCRLLDQWKNKVQEICKDALIFLAQHDRARQLIISKRA